MNRNEIIHRKRKKYPNRLFGEGVKRVDQSDGLALDPLYLSVIRMFELLTKY